VGFTSLTLLQVLIGKNNGTESFFGEA